MRARFLSASYAPYEARIEVDLAAAPRDPAAVWHAFRTAEAIRARSLSDRLAHGRAARASPRDAADRIPARRPDRAAGRPGAPHSPRQRTQRTRLLELRRHIDEVQARLEARLLTRSGVQTSSEFVDSRVARRRAGRVARGHRGTRVLRRRPALARLAADAHRAAPRGAARPPGAAGAGDGFHRPAALRPQVAPTRTFAALLGGLLGGRDREATAGAAGRPAQRPAVRGAAAAAHARPANCCVDRFVITVGPVAGAGAAAGGAARRRGHARRRDLRSGVHAGRSALMAAAVSNAVAVIAACEEQSDRLARLPYSAIEARAVTRAFAGADIIELAGFDATARRVIELPSQDLRRAALRHTRGGAPRCAGAVGAVPQRVSPPMASPLPVDRLTADDITRSGLRADVVVLSGCATGDGRELRGEGVLGPDLRLPRQWLEHRGRLAVAGGRRADRALHGGVLRRVPRHRARGRCVARRPAAHARHRRAPRCGRASWSGPAPCRDASGARAALLTTLTLRHGGRGDAGRVAPARAPAGLRNRRPFDISVTTWRFLPPN